MADAGLGRKRKLSARVVELRARSDQAIDGTALLSKVFVVVPGLQQLLKFGVRVLAHLAAFLT